MRDYSIRSKRAQSEILGLVVIVILLSLGMFFMIFLSQEEERFYKGYSDEQTIKNILVSMKRTTIPECNNLDFGEILANCAENGGRWNDPVPKGSNNICREGGFYKSTCYFINKTASEMLNATLDKQEFNYELKVFLSEKLLSTPIKDQSKWIFYKKDKAGIGCPPRANQIFAQQPIPISSADSLLLTLSVCE